MNLVISSATENDLADIWEIEKRVEGVNAAAPETLYRRQKMFAEGFKLARINGQVAGYVESCRWVRPEFDTYDQISDFPARHTPRGNELYVIFLATSPDFRKRGVATQLVESLKDTARANGLETVSLVAK